MERFVPHEYPNALHNIVNPVEYSSGEGGEQLMPAEGETETAQSHTGTAV